MCDNFHMLNLKRFFVRLDNILLMVVTFATSVVILSEDTRYLAIDLFKKIADSYLIMFIDSMSMGFICL